MNARYNNIPYRRIDNQAPKLFVLNQPARFRISVNGRYTRWTAKMTETSRERGRKALVLEGVGVTPSDALYDLEHAIREHRWGWPEGWGRREEAIGLVNWEIARERVRAGQSWQPAEAVGAGERGRAGRYERPHRRDAVPAPGAWRRHARTGDGPGDAESGLQALRRPEALSGADG